MDLDSEWTAMVSYARAAGAHDYLEASAVVRHVLAERPFNWEEFCRAIDARYVQP